MRDLSILTVASVLLLGSPNVFAADGSALYEATCARCHGENGTADTPVAGAMTIKPFQGVSAEQVDAALAKPVHAPVKLTPEVRAAVAMVVSAFGSP